MHWTGEVPEFIWMTNLDVFYLHMSKSGRMPRIIQNKVRFAALILTDQSEAFNLTRRGAGEG